jgi:serine/threonine-protein kinase
MPSESKDPQEEDIQLVDSYHFRLHRKLADGGMGSVYEATLYGAEGFEKTVAIKSIRQKYTNDRDFVDLFIGEAKLVADLVHQNIVQIYKLGKVGSLFYIAMEYVNGVNLAQFMNRHYELGLKVPHDLAAFIISRVCRGLEYAHNKTDRDGAAVNVVHRDINPKNLMISSEGEVKITDFGIAKARNIMRDMEGEVLMGKIQYMSPEQAQFQATDRRSDVFSLGIVMYELIAGENVFEVAGDTTAVLNNIIYREIPKPRTKDASIPEELEKIILKALERNSRKRYQDAGKMGYDLEYQLYSRGYGPTILTLEKYMRQIFPEIYKAGAKRKPERAKAGKSEIGSAPFIDNKGTKLDVAAAIAEKASTKGEKKQS